MKSEKDPKKVRLSKINYCSSKLLLSLVNDLLDLFQMKNGRFNKRIGDFNLKEAVNETLDIFQIHSEAKKIPLIIEIDENVKDKVNMDKGRIQ